MANYNGPARNRLHLNNYINDLNRVPSAQDFQSSSSDAPYLGGAGSDDLSLWTNASFMNDFALEASADLQIGEFGYGGEHGPTAAGSPAVVPDFKPLDFEEADFDFNDFNFATPAQTYPEAPSARAHDLPAPIQTSNLYSSQPSSAVSPALSSPAGEKRKAVGSPESYEGPSRVAAEEDKRRRNTAASARFRVKKKQREQALERSAKEMADKVSNFESRIATLETENKWLKSLITEKNDKNLDLPALWKKYSTEETSRKGSERKDGVGTKA